MIQTKILTQIIGLALLCNCYLAVGDPIFPENPDATAVLITMPDGGSGSGFFISTSNHLFLATAAHVLFNEFSTNRNELNAKTIKVSWYTGNRTNQVFMEIQLNLENYQTNNLIVRHPTHDVAIVRVCELKGGQHLYLRTFMTMLTTEFNTLATEFDTVRNLKDDNAGDEIFVFGYPSSIGLKQLPQFDYSKVLLRKGIISAIDESHQVIIIDAAVYFGNSGGPVIERENSIKNINGSIVSQETFQVIGLVSEYIPFVDALVSQKFKFQNISVSNSGYAVVEPIDFVNQLLWDN